MSAVPPPVVVTGMHRSGTSLVASVLAAIGVAMGDRLLPEDRSNPRGYFEDLGFLALDRQLLATSTRPDDGGHRDWGWTESEWLDRGRFQDLAAQARALVAERSAGGRRWGWKDPRTTLLLDFWHPLLGDPIYILLYRFPWEVADSMQRLGAEIFLRHPDYAYRIWAFYNRHLLDFCRSHRERCLLASTDALLRRPRRFLELLGDRLGLAATHLKIEELVAAELFQRLDADDPLVTLATAHHPECAALLTELDALADLSSAGLWRATPLAELAPTTGIAPRLTVVIPCFDQGELLLEAVASVARSVPVPHELIIVNDGSREPRTLEILETLRLAGYRIIDQENRGLAAARNRGIEAATTPYVLPLDADNRLRTGFAEPALEQLDAAPEIGVVYGDRQDFGLRSLTVDVPLFDLDRMLASNAIDACALVRKQVWYECGGYDQDMPAPGWEDWDLWLGAAARGWRFCHLPGAAFDYRVRPGSMVSGFADEQARLPVLRYLVAKHHKLYVEGLPGLLLASQRSETALFEEARRRERSDAEASSLRSDLEKLSRQMSEREQELVSRAAERDSLVAERDALAARCDALVAERDTLVAECERWRQERVELSHELDAWRQRVSFMERTRAWRLRQCLLAIKNLWRRRRASPPPSRSRWRKADPALVARLDAGQEQRSSHRTRR